MMKVINAKSKEIIDMSRFNLDNIYVSIEDTRVYFTKASVNFCELKMDEYLHFLNDGAEWQFYSNDDPDGFKLTQAARQRGLFVFNRALVRMIRKSTGFNHTASFMIEKTNALHDKCPLFRIDTRKPITFNKN